MNKRTYIQENKDWLVAKSKEDGVMALPKGIFYRVLSEGDSSSPKPTARNVITAHYTGRTIDGKQFDSSRGGVPLACRLCDLIEGWIIAMQQMLQLRQPVKTDIHRVVEENYTSPISLNELAYLSGRSLSSFKREFRDIYGEPPARWIREKRLSKAHEMLRSSNLSVADVAYSLGFENPTHFSRIFKQQYGYAPSQS